MSSLTVGEFLDRHISSLTGVEKKTITEYQRYLRNDIVPALGSIPLSRLSRDDIAGWVNRLAIAALIAACTADKNLHRRGQRPNRGHRNQPRPPARDTMTTTATPPTTRSPARRHQEGSNQTRTSLNDSDATMCKISDAQH